MEGFLSEDLSAEAFTEMWKRLETAATPATTVDFSGLSNRLRRGEIVLFLGSEIARHFHSEVPDQEQLVSRLARKVEYRSFQGSLSMIAEYYQMRPEYGVPQLVRNLRALLPAEDLVVPLYTLLSDLDQPLVLICSGYDQQLESSFRRQGKKFATVCSLVGATGEYLAGRVRVHLSDRDQPEAPCLGEQLSELGLLEQGYSLIYRIRGTCGGRPDAGTDAGTLTLTERDHFDFARHADRLGPHLRHQSVRESGAAVSRFLAQGLGGPADRQQDSRQAARRGRTLERGRP